MRRYYSPQIDRDLVAALYHEAKARGIPMTRLANRLLHAPLRYEGVERDGKLMKRPVGLEPLRDRLGSANRRAVEVRLFFSPATLSTRTARPHTLGSL